jgi:hypothetical protein
MNLTLDWTAIAAIATAISAIGAAWTLREMRAIAQGDFEEGLDIQYRALAYAIPVNALIGDPIDEDMKKATRECLYNYLDLSNEQAFRRMNGRIRRSTWNSWSLGMKSHLKNPEFKKVWDEVFAAAPDTFTYLAKLIEDDFKTDPKTWKL